MYHEAELSLRRRQFKWEEQWAAAAGRETRAGDTVNGMTELQARDSHVLSVGAWGGKSSGAHMCSAPIHRAPASLWSEDGQSILGS